MRSREEKLAAALSELLSTMNQDKDGSYFLCEEASHLVDDAWDLLDTKQESRNEHSNDDS